MFLEFLETFFYKGEFGEYKCNECEYTTPARTRMRDHVESAHTVNPIGYTCPVCGKLCPTMGAFSKHKSRYKHFTSK